MDRIRVRDRLGAPLMVAALLMVTTLLVAVLEGPIGVNHAATAYLLAVVAAAATLGVGAAVGTAVGAFLVYDLLFVPPRFALTVSDSREWLALVLFLVVGVVVGWLAGQLRQRARDASARESEANALYQVSRILATRTSVAMVVTGLETILMRESGSTRATVVLAPGASARVGADAQAPDWAGGDRGVLRRTADADGSVWVRLHESVMTRRRGTEAIAWKAPIEAGGRMLGAVWVERPRAAGPPGPSATRLLGVATDQIGLAVEQERSAAEARDIEIARQSEAFKAALLDSVSHDLRTPLASIRAAAGTLLDPDIELDAEERRASAAAIDSEAEHLARVVTDLLDMSRIEGGALSAELEVYEVDDLVDQALERLAPRLTGRHLTRMPDPDRRYVRADAVLLGQVLTNLVENACKYARTDAQIRVSTAQRDGVVRITIEDGGPGVPTAALGHLFDKFYRVRTPSEGSRPGSGVGMAVVRGLVEAMGGSVRARRSELGGLAVDVLLPAAVGEDEPPEDHDQMVPQPDGAS